MLKLQSVADDLQVLGDLALADLKVIGQHLPGPMPGTVGDEVNDLKNAARSEDRLLLALSFAIPGGTSVQPALLPVLARLGLTHLLAPNGALFVVSIVDVPAAYASRQQPGSSCRRR